MANAEIVADTRSILSVWSLCPDELGAAVGYNGVTRIEAYEEFGEMAPVTWFKVWRVDHLWKRLNAAHMAEVCYKD